VFLEKDKKTRGVRKVAGETEKFFTLPGRDNPECQAIDFLRGMRQRKKPKSLPCGVRRLS